MSAPAWLMEAIETARCLPAPSCTQHPKAVVGTLSRVVVLANDAVAGNVPIVPTVLSKIRLPLQNSANTNAFAADDDHESLTSSKWLIHFTDREPMLQSFSPSATHAEVLASYPDGVAAEPIPYEPDLDTSTGTVCDFFPDAISEIDLVLGYANDRHTCGDCANFSHSGVCIAAWAGGKVSAQKGYKPGSMFQEQPHRCEGFGEKP